jgi:site-specific DNA recombinase
VFDAARSRFVARQPTERREPRPSRYDYLLKGRIVCGICERKMEGQQSGGRSHYRCRIRSNYALAPSEHPRSVYLAEQPLVTALDTWISDAFAPENLERSLEALLRASESAHGENEMAVLKAEITEQERRLYRFTRALEADGDLEEIVSWIKEASALKAAAQQRLFALTSRSAVDPRTLRRILDLTPDFAATLRSEEPSERAALYRAYDVRLTYAVSERVVHVTANAAGALGNSYVSEGGLEPPFPSLRTSTSS